MTTPTEEEREPTEARDNLALQLRRHANEADENGAVELALDLREAASVLRTQEERPTEGPASEPTRDIEWKPSADDVRGILSDDPAVREAARRRCAESKAAFDAGPAQPPASEPTLPNLFREDTNHD